MWMQDPTVCRKRLRLDCVWMNYSDAVSRSASPISCGWPVSWFWKNNLRWFLHNWTLSSFNWSRNDFLGSPSNGICVWEVWFHFRVVYPLALQIQNLCDDFSSICSCALWKLNLGGLFVRLQERGPLRGGHWEANLPLSWPWFFWSLRGHEVIGKSLSAQKGALRLMITKVTCTFEQHSCMFTCECVSIHEHHIHEPVWQQ